MDPLQDDSVPVASKESAVSPTSGYPIQIISNDKADDKFCCSYCKLILRNPMQSSCGHRFCQECLQAMQRLPQPYRCEACTEEGITDESGILDFHGLFEDKAVRREMRKLNVNCVNPGCPWNGLFNDYVAHEEACDRKLVLCHQCGNKVSIGELTTHETKTCPKREIRCTFCKEKIFYDARAKHNEICVKYLIKCDNCQKAVERCQFAKHQESICANRVIKCPLGDCKQELPKEKFVAHISKEETVAKHIVYLIECAGALEQRLQRLEEKRYRADSDNSPPHSSSAEDEAFGGGAQNEPSDNAHLTERTQGDGAQCESGGLVSEHRQKLKLHEDLMSVLHSEILRCITSGEALGRGMENSERRMRDCYAKIETIDDRMKSLETRHREISPRRHADSSESGELISEGAGLFTWIIKEFCQVKVDAVENVRESIYSPSFFTGPGGYRMRLKFYANGEGDNKAKSVSLYVQTLQGPNDDLLVWPFTPKINFLLVDQHAFSQHHFKLFEMDKGSAASRRPPPEGGVAAGNRTFMSVGDLNNKQYIFYPRDTLYLKFNVGLSKKSQERLNSLHPARFNTAMSAVRGGV